VVLLDLHHLLGGLVMDDYGNSLGDFYPHIFLRFICMSERVFQALYDDDNPDFYLETELD
jgi:hypothetical protein